MQRGRLAASHGPHKPATSVRVRPAQQMPQTKRGRLCSAMRPTNPVGVGVGFKPPRPGTSAPFSPGGRTNTHEGAGLVDAGALDNFPTFRPSVTVRAILDEKDSDFFNEHDELSGAARRDDVLPARGTPPPQAVSGHLGDAMSGSSRHNNSPLAGCARGKAGAGPAAAQNAGVVVEERNAQAELSRSSHPRGVRLGYERTLKRRGARVDERSGLSGVSQHVGFSAASLNGARGFESHPLHHAPLELERPSTGPVNLRTGFDSPERLSLRAHSSVGRAPALQAGGHRFDSDRVHSTDAPRVPATVGAWPRGAEVMNEQGGGTMRSG